MINKLTLGFGFLLFGALIQCTSPQTKEYTDVAFISKTPTIDGKLDSDLEYLDVKKFDHVWQFDNPVTDTAQITYRMAYTPSHLYLYIETNVDSISYHRRGYLWGDGYKVLLGIPQNDSLTDEYYEMSYSPSIEKDYWEAQRIASYNFSQIKKSFSKSSKSEEYALEDKSGFEALIAWGDIEPYHPWFLDQIGYNIYFAKGIESEEHGYFTNGYSQVEDEGIWDEEIPKRNYKPISFEKPTTVVKKVILAKPKKNNLEVDEPLIVEVVSINKEQSEDELQLTFSDLKSKVILSKTLPVKFDKVLKKKEYQIDLNNIESGSYKLTILNSKDTIVNTAIVIKPIIDFEKISNEIQTNKNQLELGTISTLQFELNQIENKMTELKRYETGEIILDDWKLFQNKYELFNSGIDPYKNLTEPYRRAFKSKYDNTYQPYSIKLPKNYDPKMKYPLLVFMHGSGGDEQGLLNSPRSDGEFIEIAPLARDIFRAYSSDESQKDIVEAIEDVSKYFAVDQSNIIMGGFSMGGYGALRAYFEHPDLYKGIAVFAGHPNLANEWLDGDYPNFLDEKYLDSFRDMPVFIYHGGKDPAIDVNLIVEMSNKLKEIGADVTISIVDDFGHQYQDKKTNTLYFDWLKKIVN